MKAALYSLLIVFYFLHNDLWLWHDECLIAGFPSGLLYHIVYCGVASLLLFALVKYAWPENLEFD